MYLAIVFTKIPISENALLVSDWFTESFLLRILCLTIPWKMSAAALAWFKRSFGSAENSRFGEFSTAEIQETMYNSQFTHTYFIHFNMVSSVSYHNSIIIKRSSIMYTALQHCRLGE